MKVCITASGTDLDSLAIPNIKYSPFLHFYLIKDDKIVDSEIVLNPYKVYKITPDKLLAEFLVSKKIDTIISGNFSNQMLSILRLHKVRVYIGVLGSVKENLELLLKNQLTKI